MLLKWVLIGFLVVSFETEQIYAKCKVYYSDYKSVALKRDVVFSVLQDAITCPTDILSFKKLLKDDGLSTAPTMVANRGRYNPRLGSFSFFEMGHGFSRLLKKTISSDQLFFGYFTAESQGRIILDRSPVQGKLLIELIAWDFDKQLFNFYELIGSSHSSTTWFFRGDSADALTDNRWLHRQVDPSRPVFGKRMRCSACHVSGGPIMKELVEPHNDWWRDVEPLSFGPHVPSVEVRGILSDTVDAAFLAESVKKGVEALENSEVYQRFKANLSLQEILRPLFCTTEVNIVSGKSLDRKEVLLPAEYFVNPMLGNELVPIVISQDMYISALRKINSNFPETKYFDAANPWLAPVKGFSNFIAINKLLESGFVARSFVSAVLSIDLENPLFSEKRCKLLRSVPQVYSDKWQEKFLVSLQTNGSRESLILAERIADPKRAAIFIRKEVERYFDSLRSQIQSNVGVEAQVRRLFEIRESVFENEISKNPLGQILEPGFRIVFPVK